MSSDDGRLVIGAIFGFGSGIWSFIKGFRTYRELRVVEDTPVMPVRSIPMGLVHVHAKATGAETVTSPVTHTPCFFYKVDIEKWKSDGKSGSWSKYRTDADGVKFYLQEDTGKALVDAHQAEFDLLESGRCEIGSSGWGKWSRPQAGWAGEDELRSYLTQVTVHKIGAFVERRLNPSRAGLSEEQQRTMQAVGELFKHPPGTPEFFDRLLAAQGPRIQERLAAAGPQNDPQKEQARLALIEAYKHPLGSPEFRQSIQQAMNLGGGKGVSVQTSFKMKTSFSLSGAGSGGLPATSGKFRFQEYCILPDHWYDATGTCVENPSPQDEHDRNLILKGQNEPTFLISYRAEKELEKTLRKRAAAQVLGGAALAIACLAYLLYKFGLF